MTVCWVAPVNPVIFLTKGLSGESLHRSGMHILHLGTLRDVCASVVIYFLESGRLSWLK